MPYEVGDSFPVDDGPPAAPRGPDSAPGKARAKEPEAFDGPLTTEEVLGPQRGDRRPTWPLALVLLAFVVGAAFFMASTPPGVEGPSAAEPSDRRLVRCRLTGPSGTRSLPNGAPMVVNVFLQRCADCIPAFEVYQRIEGLEGLGAPVLNVAYGAADPSWLRPYGLDRELVIDPGGSIVGPLGIGTFTTLVLDGEGRVRLRLLPTERGYRARVAACLEALSEAR